VGEREKVEEKRLEAAREMAWLYRVMKSILKIEDMVERLETHITKRYESIPHRMIDCRKELRNVALRARAARNHVENELKDVLLRDFLERVEEEEE